MKRKYFVIVIGIELLLLVLFSFPFSIPCVFKLFFNIPCPGCGLTRAYHLFLHGKIIDAFFQNILFYPLILFMIIFHYQMIMDFIHKKEVLVEKILQHKILYYVIGFFMILSEIYNVMMGI